MNRRNFVTGLMSTFGAGPAIIRSGILMPVKSIYPRIDIDEPFIGHNITLEQLRKLIDELVKEWMVPPPYIEAALNPPERLARGELIVTLPSRPAIERIVISPKYAGALERIVKDLENG